VDALTRRRGKAIGQVARIERRRDVLALVSGLDRLDRLPEVGRGGRELDAERVELEPDRRGVARQEPDAADGVGQLLP
jgi:hypothetical protein